MVRKRLNNEGIIYYRFLLNECDPKIPKLRRYDLISHFYGTKLVEIRYISQVSLIDAIIPGFTNVTGAVQKLLNYDNNG